MDALIAEEPQIDESGQLRYVIGGGTALYLYTIARSISYLDIETPTGESTEDYKRIRQRHILYEKGTISLDTLDRGPLSIRPPFERVPSDVDLIPICTDLTPKQDDCTLDNEITERVKARIAEESKTRIDLGLYFEPSKLGSLVKITVVDESGQIHNYIVESPEAALEGKLKQLTSSSTDSGSHRSYTLPKRLPETEKLVSWASRAFGYAWVQDIVDRVVAPETSIELPRLPMDKPDFQETLSYQYFLKALEKHPVFKEIGEAIEAISSSAEISNPNCQNLQELSIALVKAYSINPNRDLFRFIQLITPGRAQRNDHIADELLYLLQQTENLSIAETQIILDLWGRIYDLDIGMDDYIITPEMPWVTNQSMVEVVSEMVERVESGEWTVSDLIQILHSFENSFSTSIWQPFSPIPVEGIASINQAENNRQLYFSGLAQNLRDALKMGLPIDNGDETIISRIKTYNSGYRCLRV